MIKKAIPNVVLSTDIIVGFPGETEEDFQDTMTMVQEVGFETIFAFKYSPRPFTKAAKFEDQVPEDVKSERLNRLFAMHNEMAFELVKKYVGQTLNVLIENQDEKTGKYVGRTTHNKLVYFTGENLKPGQTIPVQITQAFPSVLRGVAVQA